MTDDDHTDDLARIGRPADRAAGLDALLVDAPHFVSWLGERCGAEKAAPAELGGGGLRPLCDAPGTYILDR